MAQLSKSKAANVHAIKFPPTASMNWYLQ